jgi:glycosyltransferase involved in cell wall biosynthesis
VNIAVSASNRQSGLVEIPGLKALVVSNGIDQKKFSPAKAFKNVRQELGISDDIVLVLFIARFTAHKQPLTLIRAFREAAAQDPGLRLLMVGDGDEKAAGVALVEELGLEDKVVFQAFRHDVPDVLAAADIFVLPSLWEGLPIGLLEAMAMGKAVIATRVDGTKEVVNDGSNGLLIEPGDVGGLVAAILRLSKDGTLRDQLSRNAVRTIREQYNASLMTQHIEEIYDELIK